MSPEWTGQDSWRSLVAVLPHQVWSTTPDGAIDYANDRALGYLGMTLEALRAEGWGMLVHPEDVARTSERWDQALTNRAEYENEVRLRRHDGLYRWQLVRATPVFGADGNIERWVGTNTDIHESRAVREELEHRTEFEQYLLGIVSHDLKEPLTSVLLGATALKRRPGLDALSMKSATRIEKAAERAARMVRDLLDFTQARLSGGIPIDPRAMDLATLSQQVVDDLSGPLRGDRVIEVEHHGNTEGVWDADRLNQVLQNLLSNACRYSPDASRIRLETEAVDGVMNIRVHNRGSEISPHLLPKIFEPMQRGTQQRDHSGRSVGLGLYIVRHIVEAHGGSVEVTSSPENGTSFHLRLPRMVNPSTVSVNGDGAVPLGFERRVAAAPSAG